MAMTPSLYNKEEVLSFCKSYQGQLAMKNYQLVVVLVFLLILIHGTCGQHSMYGMCKHTYTTFKMLHGSSLRILSFLNLQFTQEIM